MSNQVKVKDVGGAGDKKSHGGAAGAAATKNLTAEEQARRGRASAWAITISSTWTQGTGNLFDVLKPLDPAYTTEAFKRKAYELYTSNTPNGMVVAPVAVSAIEQPKLLLDALSGDDDRAKFGEALMEALGEMAKDRPHLEKLGAAIDDLVGGGDVKFHTTSMMAHYAALTQYAKRWLPKSTKVHKLDEYIHGKCGEHGAMEETHMRANQRWLSIQEDMAAKGSKRRIGACTPLLDLLVKGGLAGVAQDKETDAKSGETDTKSGETGANATATQVDPHQFRAEELIKQIRDVVTKAKEDKHGEKHIANHTLKKLIADISDEAAPVKDRLYAHPDLMQQLNLLDPDQSKKLVSSMNTLEGLYNTLLELVPMLKHTQGRDAFTQKPVYQVPPEVYATLSTYLMARPGDELAPARMRVLQHEQLMAHFVDPMQKDEKEKIFRLVTNGTLTPTLIDELRDAAKNGQHATAANVLMKLSTEAPQKLEALQGDLIFRKEIEKLNRFVVLKEGFEVNPYHLCLQMWGIEPVSPEDPGVAERQREVNPTGAPTTPLTIEDRLKLEDELLDPYATKLRSEIHEDIVDDDDMMSICRHYSTDQAKYEKMWQQLRKGPGPALVEYYNHKYNGHDLRGEVNEYVSDEELLECNRILGFTRESSVTGIVGGKANVNGPPAAEKGPPKILDLDQRLREVKNQDGVPLTQVTNDLAYKISCDWLREIPGREQYANIGFGVPQYYFPGIEKDALLAKWDVYKKLIDDNKNEIVKLTPWHAEQVHAIEFLSNAVLYFGGDLATKIQRFYNKGEADVLLERMQLTPRHIADRAAEGRKEDAAKDPAKGVEAQAQAMFAEPAKIVFQAISKLSPWLIPEQVNKVALQFKEARKLNLGQTPVIAGGVAMKSIEERPPKTFDAFYRAEYGIDPELHIARTLRSFRNGKGDVTAAANAFGVASQVDAEVVAPPGEELVLDDRNQHLVTHSFTIALAEGIAADMWKAIHDGTRFNVVITKLYTDFAKEEQRLIRIAFRKLSGGIDLAFYIQQALVKDRTSTVGGEGTKDAKQVTKSDELDLGESDPTKLQTFLTAAQHGNVDVHALLKAAVANGDLNQMFRVCEEAEPADRAKILEDRTLLADIQAKCDTAARDRIYKTLTNQADLVDRLYQRSDGWGTDESGMKEDIKFYVKKLRKQFGKEIRDREDAKKAAGGRPLDSAAISSEVDDRIRKACLKLAANPSVRRILDEELSADELSDMESMVMYEGKTTAQSDVLREGKEADTIIAGITSTPPAERARLRSDAAYLMMLKERLNNPNDYRKAIDALMSDRGGDDKLAAVDTHATKKEPREMLRDLVELDINELRRLQADPELQAKLIASFEDPEQRRVARELLKAQLPTPPKGSDENTAQRIDEENRIKFLTVNALARLRIPSRDKLGWPTMLDQCIEVYKMELEPRLEVDKTEFLTENGLGGGNDDKGKKLYVANFNGEDMASRAKRDAKARTARQEIWAAVAEDVRSWAQDAANDKPKDRTLSKVFEASDMVKVVEQAVLKKADPSAERVREHLGATVQRPDLNTGMLHEVELDDDEKGLKQAIKQASSDMYIDEWSNVMRPSKEGGPSLQKVYKTYRQAADAQLNTPASADQDPKTKAESGQDLHKKKQAFIDYTIDVSTEFEELVVKQVGASDERQLTGEQGGPSRLRERDNKKYNELLDLARERLQGLYKGDGKYLIAKKIGVTDPNDFKLLDTPNRDEITAFAFRDSKYLRSRGTQAGSGWAADAEAQVVDQRMMQYGHLLAESRTNEDIAHGDARGQITADEQVKLQESGEELERALTAFKEAKAKVAFWTSLIIKVLVTVILTALTGPLAGGPLMALFFTTAIAGCSAGAAALVNEAVLAEDYDLSDEGVKMIGKEMLTAFVTAGTTMLAQKLVAGVSGLSFLGRQARAGEQVMRTPVPLWKSFLHEASEEMASETMSGIVDAGLIAIDPVHWMHGVSEGRDRAMPLMWDELGKVKSRALMAGITSAATSGFTKLTKGKSKLKDLVHESGGKPINVRQSFKRVLGNNHERVIATLTEWLIDKAGPGKFDLEALPGELLEGFLNEVNEASVEMHTGHWHEKSRTKRAEQELAKYQDKLTTAERNDFRAMHASANASDPYITVQDYVRVRESQAVDAVLAFQEANPDKKITPEQAKTFIWWARGAADADQFRDRLELGPENVPQTVQDDYDKHVQDQEAKAKAKASQTAGQTVTAAGSQKSDPAKPPPVAVVREVGSIEEGYALMRKLVGGDQAGLEGANQDFKHEGETDAIEWGLGRTRDGKIVLLRGEAGQVDFDSIPGIVALAHSHPAKLKGETRDLNLVAQNPTGVPINQLLDDANAMDLYKFLPSTGDLGYLADGSVGSHVVFTPYVHVGDNRVGNPTAAASPAQRIEIVINNPRLVGRSLIQRHQGAYSANIIVRTGDGTVLWSGPMYAVRIESDALKADQPSLQPKYIEMGMMPEPKPHTDDDGDTLEGGGIDKYKVPKQGKKQKIQAGTHTEHTQHAQQQQQQAARSAGDVFAGQTPTPGEVWSFQSANNIYRGKYLGVDENGQIVLEMREGIGRLDPNRLANARPGYSVAELHGYGPHDRITIYSVRNNPRTGTVIGYTAAGLVVFRTDQGEVQQLLPNELNLARIEPHGAPPQQQQPGAHGQQQQQDPQHHGQQQQQQDQQQQQHSADHAAAVFAGQTPMQGELWTFHSKSGNWYQGRYQGVDDTGHILLHTPRGIERYNPTRIANARRGNSVHALHQYGPTDRITLFTQRNLPVTGYILGYDDHGNIYFQTDHELQILPPSQLDLRRVQRAVAPAGPQQTPAVSDAHIADPRVGALVHAGEDARGHVALATQLDVMPSTVVSVSGTTFRVGKLFDIGDNRVAVLFEVEVAGKRYLRVAYRSNSQGGFRILPAINHDVTFAADYDKAIGEHALMVPNEIEEMLSKQLLADEVRRDLPPDQAKQVFEGAVPHNRGNQEWLNFPSSPDHVKQHVTEQKLLEGVQKQDMLRTGRGKVPVPGQIQIADQPHRPNFQQVVRTYSASTSVAGNVTALVYRSVDNTLEYVVYRDDRGRIWFKSVTSVDAEITAQGVRAVAVKSEALCTPLWEYADQLPVTFHGVKHPTQPEYVDGWRYLSQMPEIQAWYAQTGNPMPGPETSMQVPQPQQQQQQQPAAQQQQQPGDPVTGRGGGSWGVAGNSDELLLNDPNPTADVRKLQEDARKAHPGDTEKQLRYVQYQGLVNGSLRTSLLGRRDSEVRLAAEALAKHVPNATAQTVTQVFDYVFNSSGIAFMYENYQAWAGLVSGNPRVADIRWFIHESTEIDIMQTQGVDFMGAGLRPGTTAHRNWYQGTFDPAYTKAHAQALHAEYQYLADQLAAVTGESHRVPAEVVAAVDPVSDEGRKYMALPNGTQLSESPDFVVWQARAKEQFTLPTNIAAKFGISPHIALDDLVRAVRESRVEPQQPTTSAQTSQTSTTPRSQDPGAGPRGRGGSRTAQPASTTQGGMDELNTQGSYEYRLEKVRQIRQDILTGSRNAISPDVTDDTIARMKANVDKLTDEELAAIQGYSSQDYETLNKVMRQPHADPGKTAAMQGYIDSVRRGLDKLPAFEGEVYRGTALSQNNWKKLQDAHASGEPISDPAFSSSSEDAQVAEEFLERGRADGKTPVFFTIQSRTGKQIEFLSKTANETEVLFNGGAKFKVINIADGVGPDGLPRKEVYLREVVDQAATHDETTGHGGASTHGGQTQGGPTRGNAAALASFHGDARPQSQADLTETGLGEIVTTNLRHVLPSGFVWIDGVTFKTPDGQVISIEVAPKGSTDDKTPVAMYHGHSIIVSPRASDHDIVRAVAHELAEIRAETVLKLGGDDNERPLERTKHLEGRFAELRVLLSQLDAARQRPNDATIDGQSTDTAQLDKQLTELLYALGVYDAAHAAVVMKLLEQSDPAVANRLRLHLSDVLRPTAQMGTGPAEYNQSSTQYLTALEQKAKGEHVDSLVSIESFALAGAMNREQVYRLFHPLFEGPAAAAQRKLGPARQQLNKVLAQMRDVLNDPSIADELRAQQLEALIDAIASNSAFAPLTQIVGGDGIATMKAAARTLKRTDQQPGILVMDEQTRMVTVGASLLPSGVKAGTGQMSFDQLITTVDQANMTARENGLDVEYVVIVHRGHNGQAMVEILSRPRPRYRVGVDQMDGKAGKPAQRPDASGRYVVDVGVGRSAAGVEMSGHEPGKTTLIQTEYINDAEIAQMRRDQGVLDPAPIAGDNSVLVYCDFLMDATVITGSQGVTKVTLNNLSAHLTSDEQYQRVAQQLISVMAPGGEVDVQWDDSDERGDPNVKGTRGHIDGNRLLATLKQLDPKITGGPQPVIKYPYSINAAKSNKVENPGFTNPDPKYRVVIKF